MMTKALARNRVKKFERETVFRSNWLQNSGNFSDFFSKIPEFIQVSGLNDAAPCGSRRMKNPHQNET